MQITVQAHDVVIVGLALLGTVFMFGCGLALLVRVLGRRLPDVKVAAATWLVRDAAGWRARQAEKGRLNDYAIAMEDL